MPGLLRGVARTAVVAGTATAVSNRVTRRQTGRWAAQQGYQGYPAYQEEYQQPPPAVPPATTPSPPTAAGGDMTSTIDQLKELGDLKSRGVLTQEEFEEQKRRLLSG